MHLTQLLHRAVQQQPQRPLTICGTRQRTAAEVADRVARLAGALRELGVAEGDRVSIVAFNSDRYFEALLAIWWVGGVANLINVRWSAGEVIAGVRGADSEVVLAGDGCADLVSELAGSVQRIHIGDAPTPENMLDYEKLIGTGRPVEDMRRGDDALAALIYTGGTTGTAKAVMHSHRSLLTSSLGTYGFATAYEAGGAALVMAPLFHVAAVLGMFAQAMAGGTLVFLPRFVPGEVLAAIGAQRITTLTATSMMLHALYSDPEFGASDVSSVTTIVYGAAPMPEAVLARAVDAFPRASFVQAYGMTETAVITMLTGPEHRLGGKRLTSAGRTPPHAENRIVDPDGNEVPRGTVGEIVSRGDHVMQGYWKRPEESAHALRGGWMHIGDLGYMDDEGFIFVVDRLKDMIISGGENVFSTEVENVIASHPAVFACAVIGLPDPEWGERVHAVVALRPNASATVQDIREHVKAQIAGFKSPRSVDLVDVLPTTAAGKIDKRALRQRAGETS